MQSPDFLPVRLDSHVRQYLEKEVPTAHKIDAHFNKRVSCIEVIITAPNVKSVLGERGSNITRMQDFLNQRNKQKYALYVERYTPAYNWGRVEVATESWADQTEENDSWGPPVANWSVDVEAPRRVVESRPPRRDDKKPKPMEVKEKRPKRMEVKAVRESVPVEVKAEPRKLQAPRRTVNECTEWMSGIKNMPFYNEEFGQWLARNYNK